MKVFFKCKSWVGVNVVCIFLGWWYVIKFVERVKYVLKIFIEIGFFNELSKWYVLNVFFYEIEFVFCIESDDIENNDRV